MAKILSGLLPMKQIIIEDIEESFQVESRNAVNGLCVFSKLSDYLSLPKRALQRQNVSFLHGKTVPPRIFFSPQAEVFSEGSLYPRGSSLRTSEARAGN